jgi:predicted type IV restriction endonuclease
VAPTPTPMNDAQPEGEEQTLPTEEELQAWLVVKAILSEIIDPRRITMRDQKSYCAILFDDNNRRPVCRLHFNAKSKKHVGLFDETRNETRVSVNDVHDLFRHATHLKATIQRYLGSQTDGAGTAEAGT